MGKSWQIWAGWGALLIGLATVFLAQAGRWNAPAGLGMMLVAAAWLNRARWGRWLPKSGLGAPWLLFGVSAALAAGYSFAQPQATTQLMRILAGFALFCALAEADDKEIRLVGWVSLVGAALAGVAWAITHDFSSQAVKFTLIAHIGATINAVLSFIPRYNISGNVVGGVLAMAAPIGAALIYLDWRERRRGWLIFAGMFTLLTLGGLSLTSSRGAMLGLAAGITLGLLALAQSCWLPRQPGKVLFWVGVALGVGAVALGLSASGNLERLAGSVPDPTGSLQSRMEIWRQGIILIQDYLFTGAGLSAFPIVFSIYSLLIHVPYHEHMHNIFLETWFEQGVLGVAAMVWGMAVLAGWAWRALDTPTDGRGDSRLTRRALGWAGVIALTAMGVHGLLDVVFYLKPTMPLVGLAAGFAAQLAPGKDERAASPGFRRRAAMIGGVGLIGLGLIFYRPLLALGYANLGALLQTRAEMTAYDPNRFDNPTLDRVRRELNLAPAIGSFERALEYQPANRTALERLAEIELSRGEYPQALERMEQAWEAGNRDAATRMLLSDAWLANDSPEKAVGYLEGIPQAEGRVWFQAWYRYWLGEDYRRAADAWRAALLIDPQSQDAHYWIEQAQERMK